MKKFTNNTNKGHGPTNNDNGTARDNIESKGTCNYLEDSTSSLGTLSVEEIASLLFMIEEEKMARDVYDTLFEQTGIIQFDKISNSEQKHYDTLLATASTFDVGTTELSTEVGVFNSLEIQNIYDTLIAQGSISAEEAIAVGVIVEETDIADLYATIDTLDNVFLEQTYEHLLSASINHLDAFENIA